MALLLALSRLGLQKLHLSDGRLSLSMIAGVAPCASLRAMKAQ
jgi:hypothetical protein